MRKIYCKATELRIKKFQIYTSIIEENGKRYVTKEAIYEEGKEHIAQIFNNYFLLNYIHPGKVAECKIVDEKIRFPFLEGLQYEENLLEIFNSKCDEDKWRKVLEEWKQFIVGKTENIVLFDNSKQFQKIFGDGRILIGDASLKITNFDCIAENIIITAQGEKFIDYEWVFDFPIPLELCVYRVLKIFSLKNKIAFAKLLEISNIKDNTKIDVYEKMLDAFDMYISYEEKEKILYSQLGKVYKEPQILNGIEDRQIKFKFPALNLKKDSSIILYGAGEVGQSYYKCIDKTTYIFAGWVDKQYQQYVQFGYNVHPVDYLFETHFDYILLAIYNDKTAREIIEELTGRGIPEERIIWEKPRHI